MNLDELFYVLVLIFAVVNFCIFIVISHAGILVWKRRHNIAPHCKFRKGGEIEKQGAETRSHKKTCKK